jgi:hypothetical protein
VGHLAAAHPLLCGGQRGTHRLSSPNCHAGCVGGFTGQFCPHGLAPFHAPPAGRFSWALPQALASSHC